MSLCLSRICRGTVHLIEKPGIRHRWIRRSKPPEVAKSLAQKMQEWSFKDPDLHYRVNIGYAFSPPSRKVVLHERLESRRQMRENLEMQKAAKNQTLTVPMESVQEEWLKTIGPLHIQDAAEHYSVYQDLFEDAFFTPVLPLDIRFNFTKDNSEFQSPVYFGNQITPFEATNVPHVSYNSKKDELYTISFSTPDCHLSGEPKEYLHWLVGNIPGSAVDKGQLLCDYMKPFPFKGIGFCRYVFVLYKQDTKLDFSKYHRPEPCKNLSARTFSTYDFYKEYQEKITPTGLAFFQSNWDHSLTEFFHQVLDMKEPCFEYDFVPAKLRPQKWFPKSKPFNLYLDKYKDPKQLQKELLLEKLKERHPFKPPPTPPKYPLAHRIPLSYPSWLIDDIKRRRVKEGKWKLM